jgi:hypothetical protein
LQPLIVSRLDEADKKRTELQGNLDEANFDNEVLRRELDATQSQLKEKEVQGEGSFIGMALRFGQAKRNGAPIRVAG